MKKIGLIALIEAAFFAAMALVLDLLPSLQLSPSISISFAMVPIFIIAFRWGFKVSFISGFLWGSNCNRGRCRVHIASAARLS